MKRFDVRPFISLLVISFLVFGLMLAWFTHYRHAAFARMVLDAKQKISQLEDEKEKEEASKQLWDKVKEFQAKKFWQILNGS